MKRPLSILCSLLSALFCLLVFASCSKSEFAKIPQTGFLSHYVENTEKQKPFLSYWVSDDVKVHAKKMKGKKLHLHIPPVTIAYLKQDPALAKHQKEIDRLKTYFDESLKKAFKKREKLVSQFELVDKPGSETYTLEIALVLLKPTPVEGNALKQTVGAFNSAAGLLTGAVDHKGAIAFAARVKEPHGKRLAELADYHTDQSAIIGFDLKDFSRFAHHKRWMDIWSRELSESLTSPIDTKISGPSKFSLIPF